MKRLIACCGLDCEHCDARRATVDNDDALRERTAQKWSEMNDAPQITAATIHCTGCRTEGVKFAYCSDLCRIRKCVSEKGFRPAATAARSTPARSSARSSGMPPMRGRSIGLPLRKTHKQNESPRTLPATLIRRRIFCTAAPRTARRDSPAPHLVPIPDGATIAIPTLREEARKIPAQGSTAAIPAPPSRCEQRKAGRPKPSRKKIPAEADYFFAAALSASALITFNQSSVAALKFS